MTKYDHESETSWTDSDGITYVEYPAPTLQDNLYTIAFGFALLTCILGGLMAFGFTDEKWFVAGCASTAVMYLYAFIAPRFVE
jgi:hypothetical protein